MRFPMLKALNNTNDTINLTPNFVDHTIPKHFEHTK